MGGGFRYRSGTPEDVVVERIELDQLKNSGSQDMASSTFRRKSKRSPRKSQAGFTLIELMFAGLVMIVGLTGGILLVIAAEATNNRDKMDSSGTVLAQMALEMIASVPANSGSSVIVTDCNPTSSSATHTINTTSGTGSGAGAPLTGGGAIDFSQSTVSGYSMTYYACQASTGDRQAVYDVRWNVKKLSSNANLVTVAAQRSYAQTSTNPIAFAIPVTIKMIVGL
jgi:Tfp pilus assembly protein PilV